MKITGLDGKEYRIDIAKHLTNGRAPARPMSKPMKRGVALVARLFPSEPMCTEVYLPGAPFKLYADIILPTRMIALEIDGRQHRDYNGHFHKNKELLYRTQARDRAKQELLESNGFSFIRLSDADSDSVWIQKIRAAIT